MKIAFCATLNLNASTLVGRILPLARELSSEHAIHVIHLGESTADQPLTFHPVGPEPFSRTPHGKKRLRGLSLIIAMKTIALRTALTLHRLRPDIIIIAKPLPHNTLGAALYHFFHRHAKIFLDVDDFELTANHLTSLVQRAAIHWSERKAAKLAHHIFVATPFLGDHFSQLTNNQKIPTLIPTGLDHTLLTELSQLPPPIESSLLYLGSLSTSSGHRVDLLPDILALVQTQYPSTTLTIAGHGDNEVALRETIEQRGFRNYVNWLTPFSLSDVPRLISAASILIDPVDTSITQRAKSSFRPLVAAAAGRPVVTSDVGIRPQLLPAELHARFFAQPANPQDYAAKILNLIQNPLTATEQTNLKKHAANFSWTELAKRYIKALTL